MAVAVDERGTVGFRVWRASVRWGPALAAAVLVLVAWEGAVRAFGIRPVLLPGPIAITSAIVEEPAPILAATWITGRLALLGLALGTMIGAVLGAIAAQWRWTREGIVPVGAVLASIPIVATAPIFNLWLSVLSPWSKAGVAALTVFFPVLINVVIGLDSPSESQRALMRAYATSKRQAFVKLAMPSAIPYLFAALRVAGPLSVIAVVVADFFGGFRNSVGYLIKTSLAGASYAEAWGVVLATCVFGLLVYGGISLAERLIAPWAFRLTDE